MPKLSNSSNLSVSVTRRGPDEDSSVVDPVADAPGLPAPSPFPAEARRNLTVVRAAFGAHSACYRRLAHHYRAVACTLGCQREIERLLHPLRRRPVPAAAGAWRRRD